VLSQLNPAGVAGRGRQCPPPQPSPLERGERIGAGPLLRAAVHADVRVALVADRFAYRFNAKFRPEWRPRFICSPSMRDMPRIALAVLEAEAFIVRPLRLKRLLGRA